MLVPWSWHSSYEEWYCSSRGQNCVLLLLVHHQCKSRPLTRNSLVCWSIITCILIKLVEACCLLIQRNQNLKLDEEKRFLYVLFVVPAFVWNNTRFSFWKIHYNKTRLILFLLFDEFNTKVRYHNPHGS